MPLRIPAVLALSAALLAGAIALAEPSKHEPPAGEMQLPPGWTQQDMDALMASGVPGEMHEFLMKQAGEWEGQTVTFMGPDGPGITGACTYRVAPLYDGHYLESTMIGDIPGMGAFNGRCTAGFDNVTQKFVATWIDSHSTGIMSGEGALSADRRTLEWVYQMNCPINKKAVPFKQTQTFGADGTTMDFEMWSVEPKSGKEYKLMTMHLTRKG